MKRWIALIGLLVAIAVHAQAPSPSASQQTPDETASLEQPLPGVDPDVLQEDLMLLERPAVAGLQPLNTQGNQDVRDYRTLAAVLAGLLLSGATGWLMFRTIRERRLRGEPPDVVALRELEQWRELSDASRLREAVSAISATVRRYVEGRFGLQAPSLTTEEFWEVQRAVRKVPREYDAFWSDFLDTCDPIKYAGLNPRSTEFQRLYAASVSFVRTSTAARHKEAA
jgi:hypothetical protein